MIWRDIVGYKGYKIIKTINYETFNDYPLATANNMAIGVGPQANGGG